MANANDVVSSHSQQFFYYPSSPANTEQQSFLSLSKTLEIGAEAEVHDGDDQLDVMAQRREMLMNPDGQQFVAPLPSMNYQRNGLYTGYTLEQSPMETNLSSDLIKYPQLANSIEIMADSESAHLSPLEHQMMVSNNQYVFQQQNAQVVEERNVATIMQLAADFVNGNTLVETSTTQAAFQTHDGMYASPEVEHQLYARNVLQSSMSPLLAAVDDITKRDAELQLFFNQNLEKQELNPSSGMLVQDFPSTAEDPEDEDCRLIVDKPVDHRAKASLPSKYLKFGLVPDALTNDPSVFAKKFIPHPSKFGPYEGDILYASDVDLDVLHVQTPRYYPLLLVDDSHVLDVSNESSSNWMRYVRLAETYAQQNLLLTLEHGKLFLRSTRPIAAKEELRVGYSSAYSLRFLLRMLQPTLEDEQVEYKTNMRMPCLECDRSFSSSEDMQRHLELRHKKAKTPLLRRRPDHQKKLHRSPSCTENRPSAAAGAQPSLRCKVCLRIFMTSDSLRQHRRKQHGRPVRRTARYQAGAAQEARRRAVKMDERKALFHCDECGKRFHVKARFEKHKDAHKRTGPKHFACSSCNQKCATPAALAAHRQSHEGSAYRCIYCQREFKYVREFKNHVSEHQAPDGSYRCPKCHRSYAAYHLARKHSRIFHSAGGYNCKKCKRKFPTASLWQRHESTCCDVDVAEDQRPESMEREVKKSPRRHRKRRLEEGNKDTNVNGIVTTVSKDDSIAASCTSGEQRAAEPCESSPPEGKSSTSLVKLSPKKITSSSTSNRRKQTPIKLKATELNAEPVTFVALSETLVPLLLSEEFEKSEIFGLKAMFKESSKAERKKDTAEDKITTKVSSSDNVPPHPSVGREDPPLEVILTPDQQHSSDEIGKANLNHPAVFAQPALPVLYPFDCPLCPDVRFKRRGILVNHLTKLHPSVNLDEIDVLNAPLIKPKLLFHCPYCQNVAYQSNAKRKAHILKNHPGQALPVPLRPNENALAEAKTELVGSVETAIFKCGHCPRQYAARNRLVSHYRSKHPNEEIPKRGEPAADQGEREPATPQTQSMPFIDSVLSIEASSYVTTPGSPENKLLKLSSAALELSRFESGADDFNRLPALFEDTTLGGSCMYSVTPAMDQRFSQRSIEAQFFEKIGAAYD